MPRTDICVHWNAIGVLAVFVRIAYAQEFQITIKAADEFGNPVTNVAASTTILVTNAPVHGFLESIHRNATTFTDGAGTAVVRDTSPVATIAYGAGPDRRYYYAEGAEYHFTALQAGRWQPWNPTVEVALRPILNPVPMYAKCPYMLVIPGLGKSFGYDLMKGDWVTPDGKGLVSDLTFRVERRSDRSEKVGYYQREVKLFDAVLTVSFPNEGDGLKSIPKAALWAGSDFKLPRVAPDEGYQKELVERAYRQSGSTPIVTDTNRGVGYFFRIRAVKQEGKVVSALYGKIAGDISFDVINSPAAIIAFTYYLNPEPNSRNMEFDAKQNLFKNLKPMEQVRAP